MPKSRRQNLPEFTEELLAKARKRIERKAQIAPTGCWEWPSSTPERYGQLCVNYFQDYTHRWSYRVYIGPIDDEFVLHRCDNRQCCNPEHLFLGDHDANMADMSEKGRSPRALDNAWGKLTDDQIRDIRHKAERGFPISWLAAEFPDVHPEYIRQIINRRSKSARNPSKYVRHHADEAS